MTALEWAALRFVHEDPENAGLTGPGPMRDAIVSLGMMIPPLIDSDGPNLFLTERGEASLAAH